MIIKYRNDRIINPSIDMSHASFVFRTISISFILAVMCVLLKHHSLAYIPISIILLCIPIMLISSSFTNQLVRKYYNYKLNKHRYTTQRHFYVMKIFQARVNNKRNILEELIDNKNIMLRNGAWVSRNRFPPPPVGQMSWY